ncbi:conserved hypothetical protein, partial [Listeria monocytogenes FSL F2-208]
IDFPSSKTSPESGERSLAKISNKVDLPLPFGPTIVLILFFWIVNETFFKVESVPL